MSSTDQTGASRQHEAALRLTTRLANLLRTMHLYPDGHPALGFVNKSVASSAREVFLVGGETQIHLLGRRLLVDRAMLRPPKGMVRALAHLAAFLGERGCGGIWVRGMVEADDVAAWIEALVEEASGGGPGHLALNERLEKAERNHLWVAELRSALAEETLRGGDPVLVSTRLYLRACRVVARLLDRGPSPTTIVELKRVALGFVELHRLSPSRLLALLTCRRVAPFVLRHPVHMAIVSVALGHRLARQYAALACLGTARTLFVACGVT